MGMTSIREVKATFPLTAVAARSARRWLDATRFIPSMHGISSSCCCPSSCRTAWCTAAYPPLTPLRCSALLPQPLRVEVSDDGVGMGDDPPREERSFGLRMVERAADRWGHANHPTRVWFEVTLVAA